MRECKEMAGVAKLLYIVVKDEEEREKAERNGKESFRYTRSVLQSTLQLMGCKARHAFKKPPSRLTPRTQHPHAVTPHTPSLKNSGTYLRQPAERYSIRQCVVMFLAVIRCRAVAAPLNAAYTADEFEFYLSDSEWKLLVTSVEGNKAAQAAASK